MQEIARNNNDKLNNKCFNNQQKSHMCKLSNIKKSTKKKKK